MLGEGKGTGRHHLLCLYKARMLQKQQSSNAEVLRNTESPTRRKDRVGWGDLISTTFAHWHVLVVTRKANFPQSLLYLLHNLSLQGNKEAIL